MSQSITSHRNHAAWLKSSLLLSVGFSTLAVSTAALAQAPDEIVVTGTRQVIQSSIALKRQSTTIVDGLSAAEIGDIPALSIGEALETITGASSHRENGGATEISIRGLGPFLSSTVFNGREATNGSGDRSVNFSQFPSELMSKLAIYKTQDASLIEGGVAGQIALETLKPLDYGKQRIQFDIKGNVNPDQLNIDNTMEGNVGYRLTGSYVDQFEMGGGGSVGISIGGQISSISQPEQEIRSSSPTGTSRWACLINGSGFNSNQGFTEGASRDDDCEDDNTSSGDRPDFYRGTNDAYDTRINPDTGVAYDGGQDYTFAMSQRGFRQNDTSDKRNSLFGAVQFQPGNDWDVNLDAQWSERTQAEERIDLTFDNSRRNDRSLGGEIGGYTSTVDSLLTDGRGETLRIAYETDLGIGGEIYERKEEYLGIGGSVNWQATDRLSATADVSFSETTRDEIQQSMRVQTARRIEVLYSREANGFPQYQLFNEAENGAFFDLQDVTSFDDNIRLRVDTDADRTNTVKAARLDFEYEMGDNFISSLQVGGRISELGYKNLAGARDTFTLSDGDASIYECAIPFPETNFLSSVTDGNLFTTVDSSGSVVSTANGWASFDMNCLSDAILAGNGATLSYPELNPTASGNTDVTEKTLAGYVMANFETSFDGLPLRGNVGLRVVDTSVDSIGYRTEYNVATAADGTISLASTGNTETAVGGGSYTEFLPSFNAILDVNDNVMLRGAVFRGLSRADPADMNFSRSFSVNNDDDIVNVNDLVNSVNASGNPNFKPLTSWNFDAAVEWYPNDDTLFALGVYYKEFKGGFENAVTTEDYSVDGRTISVPVTLLATNDETSALHGVEITATHAFSYLPGLLSGLGTKISYNYADSDFEFNDSLYGDRGFRDENGDFVQTHDGLIAPGNIPGLSKHVLSAQVYWQRGDFDIAGYYKYRDQYFQPYTSNGTRLRFVGANGVFEARASYKINDNFKVTVEGLNLFDEPRVDYFYQPNNFGQSSVYGPRVFFGLKGKF